MSDYEKEQEISKSKFKVGEYVIDEFGGTLKILALDKRHDGMFVYWCGMAGPSHRGYRSYDENILLPVPVDYKHETNEMKSKLSREPK